jgi:hypothetical protein
VAGSSGDDGLPAQSQQTSATCRSVFFDILGWSVRRRAAGFRVRRLVSGACGVETRRLAAGGARGATRPIHVLVWRGGVGST